MPLTLILMKRQAWYCFLMLVLTAVYIYSDFSEFILTAMCFACLGIEDLRNGNWKKVYPKFLLYDFLLNLSILLILSGVLVNLFVWLNISLLWLIFWIVLINFAIFIDKSKLEIRSFVSKIANKIDVSVTIIPVTIACNSLDIWGAIVIAQVVALLHAGAIVKFINLRFYKFIHIVKHSLAYAAITIFLYFSILSVFNVEFFAVLGGFSGVFIGRQILRMIGESKSYI